MAMKKVCIMLLFTWLAMLVVCAQYAPVADSSPEIHVPTSWDYASSPGFYFWNGVGMSIFFGLTQLAPKLVRRVVGTVSEVD